MFVETIGDVRRAWLMNLRSFVEKVMKDPDHTARVVTEAKGSNEDWAEACAILGRRLKSFFEAEGATFRLMVDDIVSVGDKADVWMTLTCQPRAEATAQAATEPPAAR